MKRRVQWSTNPDDLPTAVRESLERCPICGEEWPEDVPTMELTPCE